MTRVFGALSKAYSGLATGLDGMVGCGMITGAIIMQDIIPNLLGHGHHSILGKVQCIVCQLLLIIHIVPGTLAH